MKSVIPKNYCLEVKYIFDLSQDPKFYGMDFKNLSWC